LQCIFVQLAVTERFCHGDHKKQANFSCYGSIVCSVFLVSGAGQAQPKALPDFTELVEKTALRSLTSAQDRQKQNSPFQFQLPPGQDPQDGTDPFAILPPSSAT